MTADRAARPDPGEIGRRVAVARGVTAIPSEFWSSLPYLMTVVALVAVSASSVRRRLGTPAALGIPYVREES